MSARRTDGRIFLNGRAGLSERMWANPASRLSAGKRPLRSDNPAFKPIALRADDTEVAVRAEFLEVLG